MAYAIETQGLTRRFKGVTALDGVTLGVERDAITGLLGRNGSGKTTFMSLATAQDQPTSGSVRVEGRAPFENADAIERMCFVRDNQRYPDDYKLKHAMRAAAIFYPNWSQSLADELVAAFRIPAKPIVKKFSRGQLSALGIVLGLASRAPITFFDEPYLGLDATARHIFYDALLADYAAHPRTIILSTHLINEMDRLLERVIVLDQGRVVRHASVDEMVGGAYGLAGRASAVDDFVGTGRVLSRRALGGLATVIVEGSLGAAERTAAATAGLDVTPVSLQDLVAAYGVGEAGEEPAGAAPSTVPNPTSASPTGRSAS